MNDKAGNTVKKLGRPKKELSSSQKQKIDDFFKSRPKHEKRSRREKDVDSEDEGMDDGDCKSLRLSKSPTQEEQNLYTKVAKCLHKEGKLKPAIAIRCIEEHNTLIDTLEKEGRYYSKMKKRVIAGKRTPTKEEFALDCAVFTAKKFQSKNRLEDLFKLNAELSDTADTEAKAVNYVSPNVTLDSSLGSLMDAYNEVVPTDED